MRTKLAVAAALMTTLATTALAQIPNAGRSEADSRNVARTHQDLQPAIPAIVAGFKTRELVGLSEAHCLQDADEFILTLIPHAGSTF